MNTIRDTIIRALASRRAADSRAGRRPLSQRRVAMHAGMNPSNLGAYLRGTRDVTTETASAIMRAIEKA